MATDGNNPSRQKTFGSTIGLPMNYNKDSSTVNRLLESAADGDQLDDNRRAFEQKPIEPRQQQQQTQKSNKVVSVTDSCVPSSTTSARAQQQAASCQWQQSELNNSNKTMSLIHEGTAAAAAVALYRQQQLQAFHLYERNLFERYILPTAATAAAATVAAIQHQQQRGSGWNLNKRSTYSTTNSTMLHDMSFMRHAHSTIVGPTAATKTSGCNRGRRRKRHRKRKRPRRAPVENASCLQARCEVASKNNPSSIEQEAGSPVGKLNHSSTAATCESREDSPALV